MFFLLAILAYDRYARSGRRYFYWSVSVLFALGLMAKPQIVTLPFVLLLWDYWPLQRMRIGTAAESSPLASASQPFSLLVWEKLPLFILAIAGSIITVIAQHAGAAIRTTQEISVSARLENVLVSYVRYVGKLFWPSQLAPCIRIQESRCPAGRWYAQRHFCSS